MSVAVHNADSDAKQKKNTFHLKFERLYFSQISFRIMENDCCVGEKRQNFDIHQ